MLKYIINTQKLNYDVISDLALTYNVCGVAMCFWLYIVDFTNIF